MKKIQWAVASLGAVLGATALASAGRSDALSAASTSSAASAASAAPSAQAAGDVSARADGFRASEFAGVSVRERPASASAAGGKRASRGVIGLRPGGSRSDPGGAQGRDFTILRKEKGSTALGGDKIVGAGLIHTEIATRDAKGRSARQCLPGESKARHAQHVGHAQHAASKASAR